MRRPPCALPNLTASLQESQHFLLLLAWILEQCHTPANEGPGDSPGLAFPCLLSPLSCPRALLGVSRNPIWLSTWENDLQGWGPQASMQAVSINIKQRGCPRVLPRHVLSLGQALALVWCQALVPELRVPLAGIISLHCCAHQHSPWGGAGRVRAEAAASR